MREKVAPSLIAVEAVVILRNETGIPWEQLRAEAMQAFSLQDDSRIAMEQVLVVKLPKKAA